MGENKGCRTSGRPKGLARSSFGRKIRVVAVLSGFAVLAAGCSSLSSEDAHPTPQAEWVEPLWPGFTGDAANACTVGVCVGGNVLLPVGRPVEVAVDVEAPETLGALTVERIWTGQRGGLFGAGWESVWDVRLSGGRLTGPLPAQPIEEPRPGHAVKLDDGSSLHLDKEGRIDRVCLDGAYCVEAKRSEDTITLKPSLEDRDAGVTAEPLVMILANGRVGSVTYKDSLAIYGYVKGQLTSVTSKAGTVSYTYAADRSYSYATDRSQGFTANRLEEITEPGVDSTGGKPTTRTFGYDEAGLVTHSTDLDGQTWSYTGGDLGSSPATSVPATATTAPRTTTSIAAPPPVTAPAPSKERSATTTVTSEGTTRSYQFENGVLIRAEDKECGVLLERQLDGGRMVSESHPADGLKMTRLADGRLRYSQSQVSAPLKTAVMTVDDRGRVTQVVSADGTTKVGYSGDSSRPASVTTNGATTDLRYNQRGMIVSSKDADDYEVTITRNVLGLPVTLTDGLIRTSFTYDEYGHTLTESSGPEGTSSNTGTASARYRDDGLVKSITDRGGRTLSPSYDENGELTKLGLSASPLAAGGPDAAPPCKAREASPAKATKGPDGTVNYVYPTGDEAVFDGAGRLLSLTSYGRTTKRAYDKTGRLTEMTLPGGPTYHLTYTEAGRVKEVSDGTVKASLNWHGDLLTGVSIPGGSAYQYAYDTQGRLAKTTAGNDKHQLAWRYAYDAMGQLQQVDRPSGVTRYEWDALGRPKATVDGAHRETYEWDGAGLDLEAIKVGDKDVVGLTRDSAGRVTSSEADGAKTTLGYDTAGRVHSFTLPGAQEVKVNYGKSGQVASLTSGNRTERWTWQNGHVTEVRVDGDDAAYRLEWLAPGVLGRVTHGKNSDDVVLATTVDASGLVTSISKPGEKLASLTWGGGDLETATVGKWKYRATRDAEGRPLSVSVNDDTATWSYKGLALTRIAYRDDQVDFTYADGRLSKSTHAVGDHTSTVMWDPTGARPVKVETPHGDVAFTYTRSQVKTIRTDPKKPAEEVTYKGKGPAQEASAPGQAGKVLDDLFDPTGRFDRGEAQPSDGPSTPWFEALPADLGVRLPDVITASDLARGALDASFPSTPGPLLDDPDKLADRTASEVVARGAALSVPAGPDRFLRVAPTPGDDELGFGIEAFSGTRAVDNVNHRLTGDPNWHERITDFGGDVLGTIANGWDAVYAFLTETAFGRAALTAGFMALSAVAGFACGTLVVCVVGVSVGVALAQAYLSTGGVDGMLGAFVDNLLLPFTDLRNSIIARDPVALLFATVVAGALAAGLASSFLVRTYGPAAITQFCQWERLLCVSTSQFGEAAEHVVDAQRLGAPRLLKLDRTGAQARRTSALRSVVTRAGFDRDEYPFAVSSVRAGLSIRHIDPASNRSLGSYLGHQLRPLPDGSRFYVLPIA